MVTTGVQAFQRLYAYAVPLCSQYATRCGKRDLSLLQIVLIPEIESASQHVLVALLAFQVTGDRRIGDRGAEYSRSGDAHCSAHQAGRRVLTAGGLTYLCRDAHHGLAGLAVARRGPIAARYARRIIDAARTSRHD